MHHAARWGTCRWVARCALRVCAQKHLAIAGCVQDHVSIPPTHLISSISHVHKTPP